MTAATRQARRRARIRQGVAVLPVEVDEHAFAEALIQRGHVDEESALDKVALATAAGRILRDWLITK